MLYFLFIFWIGCLFACMLDLRIVLLLLFFSVFCFLVYQFFFCLCNGIFILTAFQKFIFSISVYAFHISIFHVLTIIFYIYLYVCLYVLYIYIKHTYIYKYIYIYIYIYMLYCLCVMYYQVKEECWVSM